MIVTEFSDIVNLRFKKNNNYSQKKLSSNVKNVLPNIATIVGNKLLRFLLLMIGPLHLLTGCRLY